MSINIYKTNIDVSKPRKPYIFTNQIRATDCVTWHVYDNNNDSKHNILYTEY